MMVSALFRVTRPHALVILCGCICLATATVAELWLPAVGAALLDAHTAHAGAGMEAAPPAIDRGLLTLVALISCMAIAKHAGEYCLRLAGERAVSDVRVRLFRGLIASEVVRLDSTPSAALVSVLTSDVEAVHYSLTWHMPRVVRSVCMCLVSAAHMARLSPRLTALGLLAAPLIGLLASLVGRVVKELAKQHQVQLGVAAAVAAEGIASVRCVKAFGREVHVGDQYERAVDEGRRCA